MNCFDVDLETPENKKLKSLITTNDQDDDVMSMIFLMVKKMTPVVKPATKFSFQASQAKPSPFGGQSPGNKNIFSP